MSFRKEHHQNLKVTTDFETSGSNFNEYSFDELKNIWRDTLNKGIHGICFSMYEEGQGPGDMVSEEQVEKRIKILKPHTKWVRSFSCIEGNEYIPKVAKKHGIKTMVGAWLGSDLEKNEVEIEALIELGNQGLVDIAAVGNEVLYRDELSIAQLISYINRVKAALPQVEVGYVDAYYKFSKYPELVEACDVILSNCYPFWEGCPIDYSIHHMQKMFHQAQRVSQGKKVIITETGWPNKGGIEGGAIPSDINAMKYFINTQVWSANDNIDVFYFSSFDESWKVGAEGDVGAYWGLWDKDEKLKYL
jgi:exo-beta-1,3-glucanase (GH17 family)